ncbi:MAG: Helicase associated domain protein [Oscillospiraceae bacterium]|nr:Helicase associated domain protein [Oscillospiraceae bacterium]
MNILYPHNQTAYEAARAMLAETGKACVIHPTGTGKSFIGFQLCTDHPEAKVLWLSPSEYIFRTQLENWQSAGGSNLSNINFLTYAKLMLLSQAEIDALQPSIVVVDEFHRAGAAEWQKGVTRLLTAYPPAPPQKLSSIPQTNSAAGASTPYTLLPNPCEAPLRSCVLLGLTATNIRYLDNQRDMAEELFDGNIASEMTLGEAIARGILKAPKYVIALYSWQKQLLNYENRVRRHSSKPVRDKAEVLLQQLRRTLEKADGLDEVFRKHMPDPHGKYLVFTPNIDVLRECMDKTTEWFSKVDPAPRTYYLYSLESASTTSFQKFKQDDSPDHLRLLYTIDALNEGIHVSDINGVILFRPTISPIIYKQQIGRALTAGSVNVPVIFDVVNNFENLYSIGEIEEEMKAAITYYNYFGEASEIINERFQIIDEILDCHRLFDELEGILISSWDMMYEQAKIYYNQYGNLEVPVDYKTPEGYSLGTWLRTQRLAYAGKIKDCSLSEERIAKLNALNMRWSSLNDISWEKHYKACQAYVSKFGNLQVPSDYVTEDKIKLGTWLSTARKCRSGQVKTNYFTPERLKLLDDLGMVWNNNNYIWDRNYAAAKAWFEEHGNLDVPRETIYHGVKLNLWLQECKLVYRGKREGRSLTFDQIQQLEALHIQWKPLRQASWEAGLSEAKAYVAEHGILDAPYSYVSPSGFKLGKWHTKCRENYAKGKLTPSQIQQLESLGITWNRSRHNDWDACFSYVQAYYRKHGNIEFPPDYTVDGIWLDKWLNEQKQILLGNRPGKELTLEQREKLSSVSFTIESKLDRRWGKNYSSAKEYYLEHGNLKVPTDYISQNGTKLAIWLNNQMTAFRKGRMPESRRELLSQIGFFN